MGLNKTQPSCLERLALTRSDVHHTFYGHQVKKKKRVNPPCSSVLRGPSPSADTRPQGVRGRGTKMEANIWVGFGGVSSTGVRSVRRREHILILCLASPLTVPVHSFFVLFQSQVQLVDLGSRLLCNDTGVSRAPLIAALAA